RQAISLFLKRSTVSRLPPCRGPCRAGQFLLPRLQIPGILAVLFPYKMQLDERCSPLVQAPAWWRGGHDLRGDSRSSDVTYRALKLQFMLDNEGLETLKDELLYTHPHVVDDDGRGLVRNAEARPTPTPDGPLATDLARAPRSYTPLYLVEKMLT